MISEPLTISAIGVLHSVHCSNVEPNETPSLLASGYILIIDKPDANEKLCGTKTDVPMVSVISIMP
jgi:hypothetical protein